MLSTSWPSTNPTLQSPPEEIYIALISTSFTHNQADPLLAGLSDMSRGGTTSLQPSFGNSTVWRSEEPRPFVLRWHVQSWRHSKQRNGVWSIAFWSMEHSGDSLGTTRLACSSECLSSSRSRVWKVFLGSSWGHGSIEKSFFLSGYMERSHDYRRPYSTTHLYQLAKQ